MRQMNGETRPKVTVICETFNHGAYIAQALDGFLMQKTNFPVEFIIHDDASTDNTADVIRDYMARYPDVFTAVLQTENQFSQGINMILPLIERAKGEYIAFCEGDDYWTDENKLQIQANVLDAHPDCFGCGHNITIVDKESQPFSDSIKQNWCRHSEDCVFSIADYHSGDRFAHTVSLIYRKSVYAQKSAAWWQAFHAVKGNGDTKFALLIALSGTFYFLQRNMACYRYVTESGDSWSARAKGRNLVAFSYFCNKSLAEFAKQWYGVEVEWRKEIKPHIERALVFYMKNKTKENRDVLMSIVKDDKRHWFLLAQAIPTVGCRKIKNIVRGIHAK